MISCEPTFDTDVAVIGSGFGGAVAALRFSEAGQKVIVLERGNWVRRETFDPDLDFFWIPRRNAFGLHDFTTPGKSIFAWLASGVGGGSNTFAATMKRSTDFSAYPDNITAEEMDPYFERAEWMMCVAAYPSYPPYSDVRATQLLLRAERRLQELHPNEVQEQGPLSLAISFAPPGGTPGAEFTNRFGAKQRYSDPREQSILGGDIDSKNSLDRNYLWLAQERGAEIRPLHEVTRIEHHGDGYRLHYRLRTAETRFFRRLRRRWFPWGAKPNWTEGTLTARRLVISAGSLGSTQLLLRNRETLPVGPALGTRYSTNGDYITLMIAFRALFVCWAAIAASIVGMVIGSWPLVITALVVYYAGLLVSDRSFDPDLGVTNSDHVLFGGKAGDAPYLLVEGGRFPTLGKWSLAVMMSAFGVYRPDRYRWISRAVDFLRRWIPPFGAAGRTWPIPLLTMGRDRAYGRMHIENDKLSIDFSVADNAAYYAQCDRAGAMIAKASNAWWLPNVLFKLTKRLQVPHNLGGVPMGASPETGVVDSCGRVFGHRNLIVLDGSIIPAATGPNPALTILAISERAMDRIVLQLKEHGSVMAEASAAPTVTGQAPSNSRSAAAN